MVELLKDFIKFPFDKNRKNNKFKVLLDFLFIKFPAYFWEKPNIWKVLLFPILFIYNIFSRKKR